MRIFGYNPASSWSVILSVVFMIAFITFAYFDTGLEQNVCLSFDQAKEWNIDGTIQSHYIDSNQHNFPMIVINGIEYNLVHDFSGFFEYTNVGDSILKEKGSTNILVYKVEEVKTFILDFNCKY